MKSSASLHKKRHERSKVRAEQKLTARFRSGRKARHDRGAGSVERWIDAYCAH